MSPWDTLAGALLVERAGGRVTDFAGHARPVAAHADVLATNRLLHEELVALLEPSAAPTAGGESRA
jgi:myo-inositol-1(or 4)-monophosphatase